MYILGYNSKESKEIHRILNRTIIDPECFAEWIETRDGSNLSQTLQPLSNYLKHHSPAKLYKMRTFSAHSIEALQHDLLFLSRADHFNDPYDCLLYFDDRHLQRQIEQHISTENIRSYLEHSNIIFPIGDKFKDIDSLLEFLESEKAVFLESVALLFPDVTDALQKSTYVASLTEDIGEPTMWAHYADEHRGFAIEYQFSPDYFPPHPYFIADGELEAYGWRSLLPIFYSNQKADGTQLADWYCLCKMKEKFSLRKDPYDLSELLIDLLAKTKLSLRKSATWSYEKEWRLMITHEWPNYIGADRGSVIVPATAIYLGAKMIPDHRARLTEIAKSKNIPVYEMYIDHSSRNYEVKFDI